jgi:hypothetical protein
MLGDGTRDEPLVIRGDKLNNANDLLHEAERESNNELKPISQTKTKLTERVYDLEEGGQTALGPAVIFALNIAAKRQGSKIVICTDGKRVDIEILFYCNQLILCMFLGLANRGLGSLELAQDEKADEAVKMQALHEGNQFYAECNFYSFFFCFINFQGYFLCFAVTERARDKGISISVITIKGKSKIIF